MTTDRDFLRPHLLTLPIHRAMLRAVEAKLFAELAPDLPEPIVDIGSGRAGASSANSLASTARSMAR